MRLMHGVSCFGARGPRWWSWWSWICIKGVRWELAFGCDQGSARNRSPYLLCLCVPKTSVCQRYSNVSSALMGKELKDPLTSFDLFETSDLHDLHVSAQIQNSWCRFLQLRPVEDIHIMTGRWQIHCRFTHSFDSLSILSFCHFVSFPVVKGRKVAKHQHSSSTLEPARYETQRWTGNC